MVGRADGVLEAWDLMGRMSAIEPSATVVVASCPLTYMEFANPVPGVSTQYLAVGDHNGTLLVKRETNEYDLRVHPCRILVLVF